MDARILLRQGVAEIRRKNIDEGRRLVKQSLSLDDENDGAWVWLAATENDKRRKYQYLTRAIKINPGNFRAKTMLSRLKPPTTTSNEKKTLSQDDEKRIKELLKKAKKHKKDLESAIEQWVYVLQIQTDHPEALRKAVDALLDLGHPDDADELAWRAIQAGTKSPVAYRAAMRCARQRHDYKAYKSLREDFVKLGKTTDEELLEVFEEMLADRDPEAANMMEDALQRHPKSQLLLVRMGDYVKKKGKVSDALHYYNRAVRISPHKEAEKRLAQYPPILTDRERSSTLLAWREAWGISIIYIALAWQDVRLNLFNMDFAHILGLVISLFGGYLLITATSSPQQTPMAGKLGGEIPIYETKSAIIKRGRGNALQAVSKIPMLTRSTRWTMGIIAVVLLLVSFVLVFSASLELLAAFIMNGSQATWSL
jgi:tetratricopeptide (TPR) repeat protein